MEQITTSLLQIIYNRAVEYCLAAYKHGEPDAIELEKDNTIWAIWRDEYGDNISEEISIENLTEDLDKVHAERMIKEAEEKRKRQEWLVEKRKQEEIQARDQRFRQFQELKKEFE
jgi:hypothetical protein